MSCQECAALKRDNAVMAKLNDGFPLEIVKLEEQIAALKINYQDSIDALVRLTADNARQAEEIERIATLSNGNPDHANPECMLVAIHEIAEGELRDEQGIREAGDSLRNSHVNPVMRGIVNNIGRRG